tara:strand:+ start:3933 stop:4103 length:171 start_codon:yes stop_codon:yes gene_type:complete
MSIIKKMLLEMGDKNTYDVLLNHIARLTEEKETLEGMLRERDKLIKFYELERKKNN